MHEGAIGEDEEILEILYSRGGARRNVGRVRTCASWNGDLVRSETNSHHQRNRKPVLVEKSAFQQQRFGAFVHALDQRGMRTLARRGRRRDERQLVAEDTD